MGGRAIPQGYDSKADWALGITSQMRANEKSNSPGFPGNSVSAAYQASLNNLISTEFKPLPSMQVNAADISAYVQTLDAEKASVETMSSEHTYLDVPKGKVGLSGLNVDILEQKAREEAFINLSDDKSQTQQTDWNKAMDFRLAAEHNNSSGSVNVDKQHIVRIAQHAEAVNEAENKFQMQDTRGLAHGMDFQRAAEYNNSTASVNTQHPAHLANQHREDKRQNDLIDEIANASDKAAAIAQSKAEDLARIQENLGPIIDQVQFAQDKKEAEDNAAQMMAEVRKEVAATSIQDTDYDETLETKKDEEVKRTIQYQKDGTYVDTLGVTRDGFGREIEVGTGYSLHPDISASEVINNKIASDYTLNGKAIESLEEEQKLTQELAYVDKIRKRDAMWAEINENNDKIVAQQEFMDGLPGKDDIVHIGNADPSDVHGAGVASVSNHHQFERQNQKIVEEIKEAEKDVVMGTTKKDMEQTIEEKKEKKFETYRNEDGAVVEPDEHPRITAFNKKREEEKHNAVGQNMHEQQKKFQPIIAEDKKKPEIREERETFLESIGRDNNTLSGKDPFRFTTLAYPKDVTTDLTNGHYMLFYVNVQNKTKYNYAGYNDEGYVIPVGDEYETQRQHFTTSTTTGAAGQTTQTDTDEYATSYHRNKGAREQGLVDDIEYQKRQHWSGVPGNHLQANQVTLMKQRPATQGLGAQLNLTTRITDSVAIYLPANVEDNTQAGYQDFQTGMAGFLALSGGDVLRKIRDHDFEGAADEFVGMGSRVFTEMLKKTGVEAVRAFTGGDGIQQSFDKAFGQTLNPFIEVAFTNMGVRKFSYTFNFRPKSAEETDEVQAIIELFRFHMVPELKGTNHRYMTLPSTFDIHYMYQTSPETSRENSFYSKIATCVLEGCDVNYTPNGVKSFEDGAPTQISMTLNFMETEMLTKNKVNKGF